MNKDLKSFIQENREAFDDAHPPANLWRGVAAGLNEKDHRRIKKIDGKRTWVSHVLKVAAITFLVGTAGMLIYFYGKREAYLDYSRVNPELAAEQKIYAKLVTQKKDSIAYIATSKPALYGEFLKVIGKMEWDYECIKQA